MRMSLTHGKVVENQFHITRMSLLKLCKDLGKGAAKRALKVGEYDDNDLRSDRPPRQPTDLHSFPIIKSTGL